MLVKGGPGSSSRWQVSKDAVLHTQFSGRQSYWARIWARLDNTNFPKYHLCITVCPRYHLGVTVCRWCWLGIAEFLTHCVVGCNSALHDFMWIIYQYSSYCRMQIMAKFITKYLKYTTKHESRTEFMWYSGHTHTWRYGILSTIKRNV